MSAGTSEVEHSLFDWRVYAEATCAGLTALVPVPVMDVAFEWYFRRRMPQTTAKLRRKTLADGARRRLSRPTGRGSALEGCLMLPVGVARYILGKLWRKFIYVFAVTDAASQTSEYWHRAYLLDHVIKAGHAGPEVDWERSTRAFDKVLSETDITPLLSLAKQTASTGTRILRTLMRARRRGAVAEAASLGDILRANWDVAEESLIEVALRYNEEYARSLELDPPVTPDPVPRQATPDGA